MHSTVGQNKAKLFENRLKDINPELKINVVDDFYTGDFDFPILIMLQMQSIQ